MEVQIFHAGCPLHVYCVLVACLCFEQAFKGWKQRREGDGRDVSSSKEGNKGRVILKSSPFKSVCKEGEWHKKRAITCLPDRVPRLCAYRVQTCIRAQQLCGDFLFECLCAFFFLLFILTILHAYHPVACYGPTLVPLPPTKYKAVRMCLPNGYLFSRSRGKRREEGNEGSQLSPSWWRPLSKYYFIWQIWSVADNFFSNGQHWHALDSHRYFNILSWFCSLAGGCFLSSFC